MTEISQQVNYDDFVIAVLGETMESKSGPDLLVGEELIQVSELAARLYLGDNATDAEVDEQSKILGHPFSRLWASGIIAGKPYYEWALTIERELAAKQVAAMLAKRRILKTD